MHNSQNRWNIIFIKRYFISILLAATCSIAVYSNEPDPTRVDLNRKGFFRKVEAAILIPLFVQPNQDIPPAYRYSVPGFSHVHDHGSLIFSFFGMPLRALTDVVVSERGMDEEREVEWYVFARAGDEIEVIFGGPGGSEEIGTLRPDANGIGFFSTGILKAEYLPENGTVVFCSGTPGVFL